MRLYRWESDETEMEQEQSSGQTMRRNEERFKGCNKLASLGNEFFSVVYIAVDI